MFSKEVRYYNGGMKILIILTIMSSSLFAQNLTPEEQKNLIEENKMLKEQLQKQQNPEVPAHMMKALKKGQKYQEEQNKALEELDKEE